MDNDHPAARRIVVGVDGSELSKKALRWAIEQARLTGAVVEAVTAWVYPAIYGWAMTKADPQLDHTAEKAPARAVEDVVGPEPPVEIRQSAVPGNAACTEIDTGVLRELYATTGPFVSVYFDLDVRPEMGLDAEERWQGLCRDLASQGAEVDDLDALTRRFLSSQPGSGVLAAFAAGGEVKLSAVLPGCEQSDVTAKAPLPRLLPLLAWRQDHPAHVVAVVDRTGADLELYPAGATEGVRRTVTGPDDEIERNQPGGMSQMRYQHRAEDSWEHNAVKVAEALGTALAEVDAHVLMLAGDVRARQYLTKHLPTWIRNEVSIHPVSGSRSPDGARAQRMAQVDAETQRAGQEITTTLLHDFTEDLSPRGHAVEGIYATMRALGDSAVRTLLITDDPTSPRTAWFGPSPTDIADQPTALPTDLTPVLSARLADVAVRSALLTGADVRVLRPGAPGAPAQGIGALTRHT